MHIKERAPARIDHLIQEVKKKNSFTFAAIRGHNWPNFRHPITGGELVPAILKI
jgi:hypothetical protein